MPPIPGRSHPSQLMDTPHPDRIKVRLTFVVFGLGHRHRRDGDGKQVCDHTAGQRGWHRDRYADGDGGRRRKRQRRRSIALHPASTDRHGEGEMTPSLGAELYATRGTQPHQRLEHHYGHNDACATHHAHHADQSAVTTSTAKRHKLRRTGQA